MSTKAQPSRDVEPAIEFKPPLKPHSNKVMATTANTAVRVLTPPQRSDIQPPNTRTAAPIKAASMDSWPACTLLTLNWS